ncbi:3'-5' exonuclease [Cyanobium sp. A2C-AMD]|uniref:3'-5' exonuclease n=1 Tax=Cyanobium sp. A2C-AMD TaxID=2823695 RepID=UPI0020CD05CC|nr:3'-5' exonuclease [Cyanobium sp. A2C-AMD]
MPQSDRVVIVNERVLVHRSGFTGDLLAFDAHAIKQILDKCTMLRESPEEAGKAKCRITGRTDNLHRLRTGNFRIFYTYDDEKVSLWCVRRKTVKGQYRGIKGGDVTYDGLEEVEDSDLDLDIPELQPQRGFEAWVQPVEKKRLLPEPITPELLRALKIPLAFDARLTTIETEEDLLACPGVPDDYLLAIDRHMLEEPIELRSEQPELVAPGGVDDLLRFTQGELVGFLLRLNPEQEKFVTWAMSANGPTLVRGGPGTGKSTVAIYRAREMIRMLREVGVVEPRVLFTTYTNALVTVSRQLLRSLLGDDAICVDVRTADSLVGHVLDRCGMNGQRPSASKRETLRTAALNSTQFPGNALHQGAYARTIERLGRRYVFDEIETVIHARDLTSFAEYESTPRPGRLVGLTSDHRRAVWAVAEAYGRVIADSGVQTWEQARASAARLARAGESSVPSYDAVIVDEAQDLDASTLRLLIEVCAEPNRLFVTADVHQTIHAAGFSWQAVHDDLRFVGRTGVLRVNHRSTKEITEAARSYLTAGIAEGLDPDEQSYVHNGPPPAVRAVADLNTEADLVARFLRGATRELRLTIGSGAVLVPDKYVGEALAEALERREIPAVYRNSRDFELDDNSISILPLTAAKGLEFPVVAVAGFSRSKWPRLDGLDGDAEIEALVKARRTLFVAMTRAMRALLVVTPADDDSMLYDGFDPELWNTA